MESVYKFYNSIGWKKKNKFFKDANISEDLRFYSREYVSKCRKRILRYNNNIIRKRKIIKFNINEKR
jgi:hypothetical protein